MFILDRIDRELDSLKCLIDLNVMLFDAILTSRQTCLLFIFFLHLFILQAIYIVLQDLKMKMLFEVLNVRLQE